MKSLLELERHDCRFPVLCVGEAEGFCAEHVEGVDSYCAEHRRIAGGGRAAPRVNLAGRRERIRLVPVAEVPLRPACRRGVLRTEAQRRGDAEKGEYTPVHNDRVPDLVDLFGGRA